MRITTRNDTIFSTTLLLTTEKPVIENKPEDTFETLLFWPVGVGRRGEGGLRTQGYFKQSMPDKPLITVVTVVFNGEKFLDETIQSILNQTYDNLEYIIIDGGSTDGTLDIIQKYDHAIDYWVSERDNGIYDAMNRGIRLSLGDIIGLVNADDFLYLHAAETVARKFIESPPLALVYGSIDLINESGEIFGKTFSTAEEEIEKRKFKEIPFPHLSCFLAQYVYQKVGLFDMSFRLSADYDFLLRVIEKSFPRSDAHATLGGFRVGGRSGGIATYLETKKVHRKHGVSCFMVELTFFKSMVKLTAVKVLPLSVVRFIKGFRKKSKHLLIKVSTEKETSPHRYSQ